MVAEPPDLDSLQRPATLAKEGMEVDGMVGQTFVSLVALAIGVFLYFLPSWFANRRHKRNATAIGVLNLLAGWTIIGWIAALVWALTEDAPLRA